MILLNRIADVMLMLALPLASWGDEPPKRTKALTEGELLTLIQVHLEDGPIIGRIDRLWVEFDPTEEVLNRFKKAGASDDVLARLRKGKEPKLAGPDLPDDPRRGSIAIWVDRYYDTLECPLHSELRLNGELINVFSSDTRQSVGKHLKMGWNTLTVRTFVKGPEKQRNTLTFRIGPTRRNPDNDETVMEPVMWSFNNGTDWDLKDGKMIHRLGPTAREVTVTYQLYFAGLKHETPKVEEGDYVLQIVQYYGTVPAVNATVFVNKTPLTTFLGEDLRKQLVVTPFLKKGKNEIRLVGTRVKNVVEWNDFTFTLTGPAEWSVQQNKFLTRPVTQFKTMPGWVQEKKTGQWRVEANPDSDTLERVIEFMLVEEPKRKAK